MSERSQILKKPNFETSLKELEEIVEQLEKGELTLDQTLAKYENGIKMYIQCHKILENTEKKITILLKKASGETYVEDFNLEKTHDVNKSTLESND